MHIGIISECAMSHAHGTGVQMLRTFEEGGASYSHFYFWSHYAGLSEVPNSYHLDENLPFGLTGKRTVARWLRRVGIDWTWWNGDEINAPKFQYLLAAKNITCDVMYIIVGTEQHARRALSMLRLTRCPYVVHLMDLYDAGGIVPETMPAMKELLQNAASVLVLTHALAAEVRRVRPEGVTQIHIGAPEPAQTAQPPRPGELRIALTGRVYEGIDILAQALPEILARWPHARFVYSGNHYERIPGPLRSKIHFPGWLSKEQATRQLLDSHLAFLCGPWALDGLGKFSFPSRVADFFMAGLPVVAAVAPGTAVRESLQPLDGAAVRLVNDARQFLAAIAGLAAPENWSAASHAARQYARANFRIDAIRAAILQHLAAACRPLREVA